MNRDQTITLEVNEYGRQKAERFRAHFNLSTSGFADDNWIDAHNYLHTVCGARPEDMDEELRVLYLYEEIVATRRKLKGLKEIV